MRRFAREVLGTALSRRDLLGGAVASAAAGTLGTLGACCPCHVQSGREWNNAIDTAGVDPRQVLEPDNLPALIGLIKKAENEGRAVRMTGSGHSFSDVAMTEDYLLTPKRLNRALRVPERTSRRLPNRKLVRVESGMRLRELNPYLWRRGLSLHNMGGYDAQTIVGAAMTGTHGSGLDFGPIASQIVSIEIVTKGGAVWVIEPGSEPPFADWVETPSGSVSALVVRDNEKFNAVSVSMGCMGVVYAVTLDVEDAFWLEEKRTIATWRELKRPGGFLDRVMHKQIDPAHNAEDADHYEVYFNPYLVPNGSGHVTTNDYLCLVTRRFKRRNPPGALTADQARRGFWGLGPLETVARLSKNGKSIVDLFNDDPEIVPGFIDGGLRALVDKSFIDVSYNVFNVGPPNLLRANGIEMAFDLARTVEAVEFTFRFAEAQRKKGRMHSSPPSLRFVKASDAFLAMQHGRDTAHIEIGMLVCAHHGDDLLCDYEKGAMKELDARPHWGLDLNIVQDWSEVARLYGSAAERWHRVYGEMNEKGTFNGLLTDRLGISVKS